MRSVLASLLFAALVLTAALAGAGPAAADDDPAPDLGDPPGVPAGEPPGAPAGEPPAAPEPPADPVRPKAQQAEDSVILHNGSVWTGRIIKEDDSVIVVEHTSASGGVARYTFPRSEVKQVKRAAGVERRPEGGPRPIRDEWFLLRRGGRIVGTRRLELWSVKSSGKPGYRLEEKIEFFAQGPQLPATRTHRIEKVDLRFEPRLLAWQEEGDAGDGPDGTRRYSRGASGRVVDGEWRGSIFGAGDARTLKVRVPQGTRGRLGFREHLLRIPRRIRLLDTRIIDPDREGMVAVRAGFTSVTDSPGGERRGHEFHWEEGGRRLISFFDAGQRVIREEISEGIVALPVSEAQAVAARSGGRTAEDAASREVKLAEAGIAFTPPDTVWTWQPSMGSPTNTGWRTLGRLDNRVLLADARIEWHPRGTASERSPAQVEAWLLRRLRAVSPDLRILTTRAAVQGVASSWRMELGGTLKKESIRTIAVVVDRPMGRVVLLLAGPAGAWGQVRPALERLLTSIRLL